MWEKKATEIKYLKIVLCCGVEGTYIATEVCSMRRWNETLVAGNAYSLSVE